MALLLNCQSVGKRFGSRTIFENISFTIEEGSRWGLIGPNGAGKSTFLQILAGTMEADSGLTSVRKLTRMAYVPQNPVFDPERNVHDLVAAALSDSHLDETEQTTRIHKTLGQIGFLDETALAGTLSGGWRKRLSIALALVQEPDLLLLDEPTNHLDLEGILWLERLLAQASFSSVVVSHDRYFLENVATHMAEINRSYPEGMFRVEGNYSKFLERRSEFLLAQEKHQDSLQNRVRREVEWLRRGPKARTTKSKARIDTAQDMMRELSELSGRNAKMGAARIDFVSTDRKTKRLLTAEGLSKTLGGKRLFGNLALALLPGVKLGLAGANGAGKTTLLKILEGKLEADQGTVERAANLKIVTFDQSREQLDPDITLRIALCPEGDSVLYRDRPIHVVSWAKRFLFGAEQLDLRVGRLSGGEQARLLIARLMLQTADLLLMDEPTNDLDIPTLEVLEESLDDFPGALVLVTHDRYMLDRVSNAILGLDDSGGTLYADYSQWEQSQFGRKQPKAIERPAPPVPIAQPAPRKKLSYMESLEWEKMEARILEAEHATGAAQRAVETAGLKGDSKLLDQAYRDLQSSQAAVEELYRRWAELEAKRAG